MNDFGTPSLLPLLIERGEPLEVSPVNLINYKSMDIIIIATILIPSLVALLNKIDDNCQKSAEEKL